MDYIITTSGRSRGRSQGNPEGDPGQRSIPEGDQDRGPREGSRPEFQTQGDPDHEGNHGIRSSIPGPSLSTGTQRKIVD